MGLRVGVSRYPMTLTYGRHDTKWEVLMLMFLAKIHSNSVTLLTGSKKIYCLFLMSTEKRAEIRRQA